MLPCAGCSRRFNDGIQRALWVMYELHHGGFDDISDTLEWDPHVIAVRRRLEATFEQQLRSRVPQLPKPGDFAETFFDFVAAHDGPSLATHIHRYATQEQVHQFLRHKSIYHLKESDHTTWVIPRLTGTVKAAVVELQYDEYGAGDPNRLHATMFARGLQAAGLDAAYGTYLDEAPLEVLEQNNTMSLFGLNRRPLRAPHAAGMDPMTELAADHPETIMCPNGPMLLRGSKTVAS